MVSRNAALLIFVGESELPRILGRTIIEVVGAGEVVQRLGALAAQP